MKRILLFSLCAIALLSCSPKDRRNALLPNVSGKAGEVIVVINKADWNGEVGNVIRENLACDCPYLPQKEPLYTLSDVPPQSFTQLFKIHRNLMIMNIDPQVTEPKLTLKQNVWAKPQSIIQISAIDSESAVTILKDNMEKILSFIEQSERDRVITNTKQYQEASLRPVVTEVFQGSPYFPSGYVLKKKTDDFIWIAYETTYTNQAILMYKYLADAGEGEFTVENMVFHRNEILKANVPGMFENTYMTTSTYATPSIKYLKYHGRPFTEMRGYWEVENDFMGGPFVSHSFYSQDGKYIYVIEAFVYAPRYDKRHYLRQVESLLYSFEWENNEDKE